MREGPEKENPIRSQRLIEGDAPNLDTIASRLTDSEKKLLDAIEFKHGNQHHNIRRDTSLLLLLGRERSALAANPDGDTTPVRIELLKTLEEYTGDFGILRDFCLELAETDPYKACAIGQVRICDIDQVPEEQRTRIEKKSRQKKSTALSASGHWLTGTVYHTYNPNSAEAGFFSQITAIKKIYDTFGRDTEVGKSATPDISPEICRRVSRSGDARVDIGEVDPRISGIGSEILKRDRILLDELQKVLREYKDRLRDEVYGEVQIRYALDLLREPHGSGGRLLGWFKKRKGLPHGIQDAVERLSQASFCLSEPERDYYFRALLAYRGLHLDVDKKTVLAPISADLELYQSLPANHPAKKGLPEPSDARAQADEIFARTSKRITVNELTIALRAYPLDQFRENMNQRTLARVGDDVAQVMKEFSPLFLEQDGRWREDSLGPSVPMGRLREHPFGKIIGQPDFAAVKKLLEMKTLSTTPQQFLRLASCETFKSTLEGALIALRKLRLAQSGKNHPKPGKTETDFHVLEFLQLDNEDRKIVRGEDPNAKGGRPHDEVLRVFACQSDLVTRASVLLIEQGNAAESPPIAALNDKEKALITYGLMTKRASLVGELEALEEAALLYPSREELAAECKTVETWRQLQPRWVQGISHKSLRGPYFNPEFAAEIRELAAQLGRPEVQKIMDSEKRTALWERREAYLNHGFVIPGTPPHPWSRTSFLEHIDENSHWVKLTDELRVRDTDRMSASLDAIDAEIADGTFVPASSLDEDIWNTLRALKTHAYATMPEELAKRVFGRIVEVENKKERNFIHKDVIVTLQSIDPDTVRSSLSLVPWKFEWKDGGIKVRFGTRFKGRMVDDLLADERGRSWLRWAAGNVEGAGELCNSVLQLKDLPRHEVRTRLRERFALQIFPPKA